MLYDYSQKLKIVYGWRNLTRNEIIRRTEQDSGHTFEVAFIKPGRSRTPINFRIIDVEGTARMLELAYEFSNIQYITVEV